VSTAEQVVQLLGGLGESDRRWILDNLPPAARARLAEHVDESSESSDLEWGSVIARLADANAQALSRALEREPAWLVSAVLHAADWPWRHEVLRALPPSLRVELGRLDRIGGTLARPATEFVLRELAARARDWPLTTMQRSRLRGFLTRLSFRRSR
jgi:hypothetical protein